MTLGPFLAGNRAALVARWRARASQRVSGTRPRTGKTELVAFLDEMVNTPRVDQASPPVLESTAGQHGRAMQEQGFSVEDVVHDYADLRQAIADLAAENEGIVSVAEFGALGRRIDNAVAVAVGQFCTQRDATVGDEHTQDLNHRLGVFAHGLRNFVTTATLAAHISRTGTAGLTGPSGQILDRSLKGLSQLVDRSLAEARLGRETAVEPEVFSLSGFIEDVQSSAALEADSVACTFIVAPVDPTLMLRGDRDLLLLAVGNLLQNAFKFTKRSTEVRLKAYSEAGRIRIDVEDNCGGLPPGGLDRMFLPYGQRRGDQTGVGLGLSISRRSVEENGGVLSVHDVPGFGCIFSIDLPMHEDRRDAR